MAIDRPTYCSRLRLTHLLFVFPLLLAFGLNHFITASTSTSDSATINPSGMASRLFQFFRFSPSSTTTMGSLKKDAPLFKNVPAPGVEEYYPLNEPEIGSVYSKVCSRCGGFWLSAGRRADWKWRCGRTSIPRTRLFQGCSNRLPFAMLRSRTGFGS